MMNHAVLRRELRRLLRSWATWTLVVLASLLLRSDNLPVEAGVGSLITVAGCLAIYWAHRSMLAELEEDTIEQLGTLPISPRSIALQMGTGAGLAALAYSAVGLAILAPGRGVEALELWLRLTPIVMVMGWLGGLGAFRYGDSWIMSWTLMLPMAFMLCFGLTCFGLALAISSLLTSVVVALTVGLAVFEASFECWQFFGGQWIESLIPIPKPRVAASSAADGTPAPFGACVPDGISPLFWYDCKPSAGHTLALMFAPACLLVVASMSAHHRDTTWLQDIVLAPSMFFGSIILALMVSGRTAAMRRAGMWADVAVTPLPARSIVLGQVGGPLLRAYLCLGSWFLTAWAIAGGRVSREAPYVLVGVVLAWALAAFAGFLSGSVTTGWKAGALSLASVYFCVFGVITFVSCFNSGIHWPKDTAPVVLGLASAATLVFGCLYALYALCVLRVRSVQA